MLRKARTQHSALLLWLGVGVVIALVIWEARSFPALHRPPPEILLNLEVLLNSTIRSAAESVQPATRFLTWLLEWPIQGLRLLLTSLPWATIVVGATLIAYAAGGMRLALFTATALLYIVLIGYWKATMTTLAVVAVAVPISVLCGLLLGIMAHRNRTIRKIIAPIIDLMQTVPTFAYLIPVLVLFGVGPVVGMIASAIYAIPPMIRNVTLGLDRVPNEIIEPAAMAGSTPRQELWWVKVPTALPSILLGVNQTIMAVLSMVVIASILGGLPDIGWEVYSTMKKAQFGQSILAGLVIALVAMVLDRISFGLAKPKNLSGRNLTKFTAWIFVSAFLGLSLLFAWFIPVFREYPAEWQFYPARELNDALDWFTRTFFWFTQAVKNSVVFYLLLPLKIGLREAASPTVWGFAMNPPATLIYLGASSIVVLLTGTMVGWTAGVASALALLIYFFGLLGLPWLAIVAIICTAAFSAGGRQLCLFSFFGLLFIALNGAWDQAMLSLELTAAGVIIAFLIGSAIGVWAALNDRVSAALRPINDTLQTMPSFVFLIPAIMIFLVGEFTALVAIVLYAIVPSIRYAEHGIRNVPAQIVEAAAAFGSSGAQIFWHVRLPLALPELMLGLNQTIMMALAMVVVAALVGAQGLGQDIMIALTWMDVGKGIVFGLSIAIIAMIADRITQSWATKRKLALGLG